MQQQQQQYPGYSYWQQPVYPPQPGPSNGGFTPYAGPFIPLGPPPSGFDLAPYQAQQEPATPRAHKKPIHRRAKTIAAVTSNTLAKPLKSALKKTNTLTAFPTTEHGLSRSRTNSVSRPENSLHRIRTHSNARPSTNGTGQIIGDPSSIYARHLFISFRGFNELQLANISTIALKEMQETIWPLWHAGATLEVVNYTAIVRFNKDPWDLAGPHTSTWSIRHNYQAFPPLFCQSIRVLSKIKARSHLCMQGYSFQTSFNLTSTPQLIFQPTSCDEMSDFFLGFLSAGGKKFTLIKAPDPINIGLNPRLRDILPGNVTLDLGASGDLQTVELKQSQWRIDKSRALSPNLFFMQILQIIQEFGYYLDAAIPLYRRGPLGMRLRRELLVFKGHTPT